MQTPIGLALVISLYMLLSFLFTALLVRKTNQSSASRLVLKHFYIFPLVPPATIGLLMVKTGGWMINVPMQGLRSLFEKLSGRKTLRKKRYNLYHYRR